MKEYEDVAASQNEQVLGATGNRGDYLSHLIIVPATTSPGAVTLLDGNSGKILFSGGASSVSNLVPFTLFCGFDSLNDGGFKVTTGANVSVRAVGDFT